MVQSFVDAVNGVVWGWPMLILLLGTHLYLTFRLKFIQKNVFTGIRLTFTQDTKAEGDVTQWGALATALAATLGTGNLVGVATAVVRGGPGAVFWLWITGLFGIATKYSEAVLAIKYRVRTSDGLMLGGPMYALEKGMNAKWLGILFSLFAAIACFGIGNLVQVNSITANIENVFLIPAPMTGVVLTIFTFLVIVGGIKSIARVAEKIVPVMAILFFLGDIYILFYNAPYIVPALTLIVKSAFSVQAITGAIAGYSVMASARFGIARGLFSNEAGLGSAPIAAAAAITRNPVRQGLVSMSQVFWDTIVLCLVTGTVYVSSILRDPDCFLIVNEDGETALINGNVFAAKAFEVIPVIGPALLAISIMLFAWTTIISWEYYGERGIEYLFGRNGKKAIIPFRVFYTLMTFVGSVTALNLVWDISDMFNAFMAFPNLISMLALSGVIVKITKEYLWDKNLDGIDSDPIPVIQN